MILTYSLLQIVNEMLIVDLWSCRVELL